MVQGDPHVTLSPDQIAKMDWLAENVRGSLPKEYELQDQAKPAVLQQGVKKKEG